MIDDKKIEEAAQGAADLYEQDLPIMSYNEDTEVDGQHHFCQEFGAELFKDGAKWAIKEFLKDLWHSASEKPADNEDILIESTFGSTPYELSLGMYYDIDECDEYYGDSWEVQAAKRRVTRWLYVDDILPKKGGKQ